MIKELSIDLETYSDIDISKCVTVQPTPEDIRFISVSTLCKDCFAKIPVIFLVFPEGYGSEMHGIGTYNIVV